ncbi:hypothetical protein KL942_003028 [Ogataea angusta]|uniref:Uncharacterized protein n=1 Tax=Pichia angusta TaxID=870730 RepID=A0ABQ7RQS3_PICAN|nr:hypothetical protein KL920_005091 [Ogataea angusta]KAG7839417.1 hypothetical protein KL942_003028 [Ogataea angusta]KAG7845922.1 hypothetical protein KL940_004967 [Ogataea angusta]KAG7857988.1 hypothetical protein KL919_003246 [Ogataea angusta]
MPQSAFPASRQDFVAKVRFLNDLPPPPCPPKMIDLQSSLKGDPLTFSALLSSVFRKDHFSNLVTLDDELGLHMSLLENPKCIEENTLSPITALAPDFGNNSMLHPEDKILLTDPTKTVASKEDSVSFLRRTQYISSDRTSARMPSSSDSSLSKLRMRKREEFDAKSQLRKVEKMFAHSDIHENVEEILHPSKKGLRAKKVWSLLPDTSMLDQNFYDIKFASSSSFRKERTNKRKAEEPSDITAPLFKLVSLSDATNFMTLYTADDNDCDQVNALLKDTKENAPASSLEEARLSSSKIFTYQKLRDYDSNSRMISNAEFSRQLAITFDERSSTALFVPIKGRIELKKRRIDSFLEPKLRALSYDEIKLNIREPTRAEVYERDIRRSNFDPMEFGADEEEANEGVAADTHTA